MFSRNTKSGTGFQPVKSEGHALESSFQGQDAPATIHVRYGAYLPHWTRDAATYAVTFRLADSLPQSVLVEYKIERQKLLNALNNDTEEPTTAERDAFRKLFSSRIDNFLDAGSGSCWMNSPQVAEIVANALKYFADVRYRLHAWCVMPNHVHVVVEPINGHSLTSITHSWKSFSANHANKLLNRRGEFWQPEPYDHLIRDEEDYNHSVEYVLKNPEAAGLTNWPWVGNIRQNVARASSP